MLYMCLFDALIVICRGVAVSMLMVCVLTTAWAHNEVALTGVYDVNYAQDFSRCPQHFLAGVPPDLGVKAQLPNQEIYPLCYHGFASVYAKLGKISLYSAHRLNRQRLDAAKTLVRVDGFHVESRLPLELQVTAKDYQGAGYDRGHLAPNADMSDGKMQYDSFAFANIIPQHSVHNRELWRYIEAHVRRLSEQYDEVYVVTGTAFHGKMLPMMQDVVVPSHIYKAVYIPSVHTAAVYYAPNDASGVHHVLDLYTFYALTGVVAFPKVGVDVPLLPNVFAMDAQGMPIAAKQPADGVGRTLVKMLRALWQALGA